ncbi:MAG: amidohydrolase [Planctomycetes bacterium]|nr:amidohydrolase [Planctomycetota bacterium]
MIIDCHVHLRPYGLTPSERADMLVQFADKLSIDKLCVSLGPNVKSPYQSPPEEFITENTYVLDSIALHPDRFIGFCHVNPAHVGAALREIDRCIVERGMGGIKLLCGVFCNDPRVFPIVERAIELDVPILQHTWLKVTGNLEFESTPDHFADLATRYPEAKLIFGHTGGDWEYGVKAVTSCPNTYLETAGGNPEAGFVETAVREVGAERVVYGSDAPGRSFASQMAKVYGADISDEERGLILGKNMETLLNL